MNWPQNAAIITLIILHVLVVWMAICEHGKLQASSTANGWKTVVLAAVQTSLWLLATGLIGK